jgi:general stress protein CsbA
MYFESVRYNLIPTIVFIIHVLNASYRSTVVRSYQILTLDAVAYEIASETINKSLYEVNSTGSSFDRLELLFFPPPP